MNCISFILSLLMPVVFATSQTNLFSAGHSSHIAPSDTLFWMKVSTDSGIVHAAVAVPNSNGSFPVLIILHGTHGFAEEYIELARRLAQKGIVGVAACWFAGRKGEGVRFIHSVECENAPPFVDAPGIERFRIARHTSDSLISKVKTLPKVQSDNVTVFGHSRGAGAALDYVLTHPGKAKAVILNSAGYPVEVINRAAEITEPILILHGIYDSPADGGSAMTNIQMAKKFELALRDADKKVEAHYFENSGHSSLFTDSKQFDETVERIINFIKKKNNRF